MLIIPRLVERRKRKRRKERRKIRYTRNEMHTFVATCFSPDKHFQESNPQILVQNGDGQTSRDTLLSIAAKHVVTSLDGKGRREIRPDSLKRRGGRGEVTRGEGRRKIDKRKKKRRAEIEGGEGKRRDKREGGRKKISNKKGTPLIRAPSNHFLLSTLMVDDAYRARVCSKHRKGYSGRERGQGLPRCRGASDGNATTKERVGQMIHGKKRGIEVSTSDGDEIAADITRVIACVDSARLMMAEKCNGFINGNLSLDRLEGGPTAGATINPLRSLGCGLT